MLDCLADQVRHDEHLQVSNTRALHVVVRRRLGPRLFRNLFQYSMAAVTPVTAPAPLVS